MSPAIPRSLEITVLTVAVRLAGLALVASAVTGLLMLQGVLRASPTRFAALAVAALTFINWLVRLLIEIARLRSGGRGGSDGGTPSDAPAEGGPSARPAAGASALCVRLVPPGSAAAAPHHRIA